MKGIWKDGSMKFSRDNNVKNRGLYGHELGANGGFGWMEWVRGSARKCVARQVHKANRRQAQVLIEEQLHAEEDRIREEDAIFLKEAEEWESYYAVAWDLDDPWDQEEDPGWDYDPYEDDYDPYEDNYARVADRQFFDDRW